MPPTLASRIARLAGGLAVLMSLLLAGARPARADGATPYLRLHAGGGYAHVHGSGSNGISDNNLSGVGVSLGVAFGVTLPESVSVFGTALGILMPGASYDYGGATANSYTLTMGAFGGIGAGAAYSFVPSHVTVSGALAAMEAATYDTTTESSFGHFFTHVGVGLHVIVGKVWPRPASHWRLGVAGELTGRADDHDGRGLVGRRARHPLSGHHGLTEWAPAPGRPPLRCRPPPTFES